LADDPVDAVSSRADLPMRLWLSCTCEPEGRVFADGVGDVEPMERFYISANGQDIDMVVLEVRSDRRWHAQDWASFERDARP
jgi:hypothetical protein